MRGSTAAAVTANQVNGPAPPGNGGGGSGSTGAGGGGGSGGGAGRLTGRDDARAWCTTTRAPAAYQTGTPTASTNRQSITRHHGGRARADMPRPPAGQFCATFT